MHSHNSFSESLCAEFPGHRRRALTTPMRRSRPVCRPVRPRSMEASPEGSSRIQVVHFARKTPPQDTEGRYLLESTDGVGQTLWYPTRPASVPSSPR